MTRSEHELEEMLHEAHRLPSGPARFAAYDAVFRHADAAGATKFAFDARMRATSEFHHGGDPTRAFLSFSWCLATADRAADLVGAHDAHTLLWHFKWIVWALPQFPDIPLDRTMAVLDDMERRYRLHGNSLHAVFQHRWLVAHHIGDAQAAQHWYDQLVTARRDGLSDCAACVPSGQVRHLASVGRHEEAIRIGAPYRHGGCTEQPHWMLAELLLPYLATGRVEEMVDAHKRGYRRIREDRHHLDNAALHVAFCGRSGNEAAGLAIVEHHLSWLERPSSPFAEMEFAAASAQVLGRLRDAGEGDRVIRRRSDDGTRRFDATLAEVHDELAARATALAARFDARNGNTHQSARVAARMTAEPLHAQVPLTVLAGRVGGPKGDPKLRGLVERVAERTAAGDHAGAARAQLAVAHALRNADRWDDAVEAAEEAVRGLDRTGQADEATRCRYLLWELYRRGQQRQREALAVLDAIGQAPQVPDDLPGYEVLLEQSLDLLYGADRLLLAARRHRAADRPADEFRTLRKAAGTMRVDDERLRPALDRLDALAHRPRAGGAGPVRPPPRRHRAAGRRGGRGRRPPGPGGRPVRGRGSRRRPAPDAAHQRAAPARRRPTRPRRGAGPHGARRAGRGPGLVRRHGRGPGAARPGTRGGRRGVHDRTRHRPRRPGVRVLGGGLTVKSSPADVRVASRPSTARPGAFHAGRMRSTVVVGISPSLAGLQALRYAVDVARERGAAVHAVRTWLFRPMWRDSAATFARRVHAAEARLLVPYAFEAAMGGVPADVEVEQVVLEGLAGQCLVDHAGEEAALLVVGGDRRSHLLGSGPVTRYCVRHARCPVLVTPPPSLAQRRPMEALLRELGRDIAR
ncbi:universal stress protein [Asanoa siamensis]|uniref:UspA domain-containing protein n=1 Tax=Asanoa siamensis TaxID=926357 RepID=A0ABQ4CZ68_9ACTN|nr:universal stress protein [Asanoa siamensis]GIF76579.1 hypothetical protein Asi02nite_60970 [Asanoa siamensis]